MKRPMWLLAVAIAAVIAIVVVVLVTKASATPFRHADGYGPLASRDAPGNETLSIRPGAPNVSSWTWGMRLCLATGSSPAVIDSVGPTESIGTGFRFLGALVREFVPTADETPIAGVENYPPAAKYVPEGVQPAQGFVVRTKCSLDYSAPYTELLIGLQVLGPEGGGWQGVDVHYTIDGHDRVLAINHGLFICGTSTVEECPQPPA